MTTWDAGAGFRGPLIEFLDALLKQFYPPAASVRLYQAWLHRELSAGVGPFPCRSFAAAVCDERLRIAPKVNFFHEGLPFPVIATDNEATSSLFAACRAGDDIWGHTILSALQERVITTGLLTDKKSTPETRTQFSRLGLNKGAMNQHGLRLSTLGLKLCHIANASNYLEAARPNSLKDELEVRICRTLSPLNVFPFPDIRKFAHHLEGRKIEDLGECPDVQTLFAAVLHRHLQRFEEGQELPGIWFVRTRPGYGSDAYEEALRRFDDATVEILPLGIEADRAQPSFRPEGGDQVPRALVVSLATIQRLDELVRTRAKTASESKFVLKTDRAGWRFEVERPTSAKMAELFVEALEHGLTVVNEGRSGRKKGAPQYDSQFGSCYIVQTHAWKDGWNYLE